MVQLLSSEARRTLRKGAAASLITEVAVHLGAFSGTVVDFFTTENPTVPLSFDTLNLALKHEPEIALAALGLGVVVAGANVVRQRDFNLL